MELGTSSILWNIVNLAILIGLLWWVARRPLMAAIAARQERIANSIVDTESQLKKVEEQLQEQQRLLDEAQAETQRIMAQAEAKSQQLHKDLAEATSVEVQALRARTQKEIQQETDKAIYEIRREAAHQAVQQAERLLADRLSEGKMQDQLLESFTHDLGGSLNSRQ